MSPRRSAALIAGARDYLGSVAVAVLLAPVLPDVAVDLFGDGVWDPWLRIAAVALVLLGCVAVFRIQVALVARRAARTGLALESLEPREVLVVPIGHRSGYTARAARTGQKTVVEWLVDSCAPTVVIGVGTPEVSATVPALRAALATDGIELETVELHDVRDPAAAVADAQVLVVGLVEARGLRGRSTYVDVTGGNVPMSLAMLRVGAVLGTECTYVSSDFRNNEIVPGSQRARAFDPVALAAGT